jgi:drug/metabolite transporter (DMT)-like permease
MEKGQRLMSVGIILMIGSTVADSFFDVSDIIVIAILAAAAPFFWFGFRYLKRVGEPEKAPTPVASPPRRFALMVSAFALGSIFGFFTLQHSHPELTTSTHILVSVGTFVFGGILSYRQYLRFKKALADDQNSNNGTA